MHRMTGTKTCDPQLGSSAEEREKKTAVSRLWGSFDFEPLMFPRDPIETLEAPLKDHP
jgi:hypothetical protein